MIIFKMGPIIFRAINFHLRETVNPINFSSPIGFVDYDMKKASTLLT